MSEDHAVYVPPLHHWGRVPPHHASDSTMSTGRIIRQTHHTYRIVTNLTATGDGPDSTASLDARVSGAFEYRAATPADFPALGDWVYFTGGGAGSGADLAVIHSVLPRQTVLSRTTAGKTTQEQVFVANIDVIFLVFGLDGGRNFTEGLLDRSLVTVRASGARPVVVLNKVDCSDIGVTKEIINRVRSHTPESSVHVVSALRGDGIPGLREEAGIGMTVGLLGKSGVGKSALVNALSGYSAAKTGLQRAGDRSGRHTTSHKELYLIPDGPVVADLPGLRELQIWGDDTDLDAAFPDIEALAAACRFRDCTHNNEPGCMVRHALETGDLTADRYASYLKYRRELAHLNRRRDQQSRQEDQKKWRRIAMESRRMKKN